MVTCRHTVVFPEPTSLGSAAHFVSSLCEQPDAAQFDEVVEASFGLRGRSRRVRPHLVLEAPMANRRAATVGVEPQRGGQHGQLRGAQCAYRDQGAVGSEPGAHRAHLGDASLELLGQQPDAVGVKAWRLRAKP